MVTTTHHQSTKYINAYNDELTADLTDALASTSVPRRKRRLVRRTRAAVAR